MGGSGVASVALLDIWTQTEEFKDTRGLDKQDAAEYEWSRPRESMIVSLTRHENTSLMSECNPKLKPQEMPILSCGESGAYDITEEECEIMEKKKDNVTKAESTEYLPSPSEPAMNAKHDELLCKPKETESPEDESSELETPDSRDNASLSE